MDPRLLDHFNDELAHVREMGAEFAREFPKVAARLGMNGLEVADPYVERLIEAFAFVSARIRIRLDAEFPRFTQHLLEIVYPHYLAPMPSCGIVEFVPRPGDPALATGARVPRGTLLRSSLSRGETTGCTFRTAHEVRLWPIELAQARYFQYASDLPLAAMRVGQPIRGGLRLQLQCTGGLQFAALDCDELTICLKSEGEVAMRLYEALLAHKLGAAVVQPGAADGLVGTVAAHAVDGIGFDEHESLLPYDARGFQGYRLLHEYFAFPARFLFIRVSGLARLFKRVRGAQCELVLLSGAADARLEPVVDRGAISLHATPVVNLFARRADRVFLSDERAEHHLVIDRARPLDFEVFSVSAVRGLGTGIEEIEFLPFYASPDRHGGRAADAFYTIRREPRMQSSSQRRNGTRSGYIGTEVFLSLVDSREAPYSQHLEQLAVEVLATNRDLPLLLPTGESIRLSLDTSAPIERAVMVRGPSRPRAGFADGDHAWRLLAHLSLNYLSLFDANNGSAAAALKDLLALYADDHDPAARHQRNAVQRLHAEPVIRRLPLPGPITFGRGLRVAVTLDEAGFAGAGAFLFGTVLERFFARHVSVNSFVETQLMSTSRGEIGRWPARSGLRPIG